MKSTQTFFTRRNLQILAGGVLLVYVLAICGNLAIHKINQVRRTNAANAERAKFNKLSPAEKAIRKAELHKAEAITTSLSYQRLLYDYLQRTYNLNPKLGVAKTPLNIPKEGERGYSEELYYMARIAFPDIRPKTVPKHNPEGISFTNIYSAHCDDIPLPTDFWQAMRQEYKEGGYFLTHDALAFRFIRDNNCAIPDDSKVLESQVNRGMVTIIENSETIADLRYEAIAFLLLADQRDQVKQGWIDQIIAEQKADGSWSATNRNNPSDDHATLLAMWALLQYSRPDVEYQPLIRHPSN